MCEENDLTTKRYTPPAPSPSRIPFVRRIYYLSAEHTLNTTQSSPVVTYDCHTAVIQGVAG